MAIENRDLGSSQKKEVLHYKSSAQVSTGATQQIALLPFPCTLESVKAVALGVSGAMQLAFQARRFAGGNTAIALGISNLILQNFGTSGALGYSGLAAAGSTLLQLQTGDVLMFETSVANSAASEVLLELVVKKTQDIVSHNGVST